MPTHTELNRIRSRQRSNRTGISERADDFIINVRSGVRPISILMEGDSWFDYPLNFSRSSNNIAACLKSYVEKHPGLANIMSLAKNGDTANAMSQTPGSLEARRVIAAVGSKIDFLLISAGGNDIVGEEMVAFLNTYQAGFSARDCIRFDAFTAVINNLKSRYFWLMDLLSEYARHTDVITYPYCYLNPAQRGLDLKLFRIGDGWIYIHLQDKGIPDHLHADIVRIMLDEFFAMLKQVQQTYDKFHVMDTRSGILQPGSKHDWADEMHPSAAGFKKLAKCFVQEMHRLDTRIPLML